MKRANVTQGGLFYENRIIIESIEDLEDYFLKEREPDHKWKLQQFLENDSANKPIDFKNMKLESYAEMMQEKTGRGAIHWMADFESKTRVAMIKWVANGHSLMVNEKGGWCFLNGDSKIEWLGEKQLSELDIKITQFRHGDHYYAKIGKTDVVDEDGSVKWNTYRQAEEKAKQFLLELTKNKKQ